MNLSVGTPMPDTFLFKIFSFVRRSLFYGYHCVTVSQPNKYLNSAINFVKNCEMSRDIYILVLRCFINTPYSMV